MDYYCARNSAAQADITTTPTRVEIDTQIQNSDGSVFSLDTVTNVGRLTINQTGTYMVVCDFDVEGNDNSRGDFIGYLYDGGVAITGAEAVGYIRNTGGADRNTVSITYLASSTSGDYLEMFVARRAGPDNVDTVANSCRITVLQVA